MVPHDCFADEVAIDFPNVGRLVQRMRATFFAENPGSDVEYAADVLRSEEPRSAPASRFDRQPPGRH